MLKKNTGIKSTILKILLILNIIFGFLTFCWYIYVVSEECSRKYIVMIISGLLLFLLSLMLLLLESVWKKLPVLIICIATLGIAICSFIFIAIVKDDELCDKMYCSNN